MVVNLDADLFSSTLYVLSQLDPYLREGDVIMFDELGDVLHEFRAFNASELSFGRDLKMIAKHPVNGWICDQVAFVVGKRP